MSRDDIEILAGLLRAILAELRGMRADLAGRDPVAPLRSKDLRLMARIIPVLAEHFGGSFSTWELVDLASGRDVLAGNLRIVLGKLSAQQLGQLFQRVAGRDFGGLRIVREGRDGNGAKWCCCVTAASLPPVKDAPILRPFNRTEGQ